MAKSIPNQSKQDNKADKKSDLWKLRHTAEHVLHQAVKELFPSIQLAMGPATDDGFYFDFDSSPEGGQVAHISEADFPKIEAKMQELIDLDLPLIRREISIEEAREIFKDNPYKLDWIDGIAERGEKVTVYWTGEPGEDRSMVDLCAGPHAASTGAVKAFKLLNVAGAYWHGDENNKMLMRIYGTAFASQEELDKHLHLLEEARKRDHKKLGKELDLFLFSDLVGPGLPLWTPKGTILRDELDDFVWQLRKERGYQLVEIPHITKKELYQTSGHWDKFADELFRMTSREGHEFAMKPMNCPHHVQIFARKPFSYREMPQRYASTTMCYRDEQTGELSGLSRVRSFTQDDAHVFCRQGQFKEEALKIWDIVDAFYGALDFDLKVRLSLSDPAEPKKYLGDRQVWEEAEKELRQMAKERGVEYFEAVGEAAFYGPKIDFLGYDSLDREWQVATIQLDMNMPARFKLFCINEDGDKEPVVMVHAAIMGSIERFLSILIEHYAGAFPVWLSPVQVKVLPIADRHHEYARQVVERLEGRVGVGAGGQTENRDSNPSKAKALRVELDDSSESLSKKIRKAQVEKVPYMLVVGDEEIKSGGVGVRSREQGDQGFVELESFAEMVRKQVEKRKG